MDSIVGQDPTTTAPSSMYVLILAIEAKLAGSEPMIGYQLVAPISGTTLFAV